MKHKIENAVAKYENILVLINGEWIYLSPSSLIGLCIEGNIVKKRTRKWLV